MCVEKGILFWPPKQTKENVKAIQILGKGVFLKKENIFLSYADSQGEALPVPPAGPKIRRGDFLKKLRCNY